MADRTRSTLWHAGGLLLALTLLGAGPVSAEEKSPAADASRPVLMAQLGHSASVNSAVFSPNGKQVLTASGDESARLWEIATGQEVRRFDGHVGPVFSAVFSPDGKQVLTASFDWTARLWETATGQEVRRFEGPSGSFDSAVFSPDGKQVLTTNGDETARLWETATGERGRRFEGHARALTSAVFSPDGKQVLTASRDKTARLWETATGQEVRRFDGHSSWVSTAVFSPDGRQILTASSEGTVRLWETATGQEVRRFEGHSKSVTCAVFSPEGTRVLTTGEDTTARLWETATGREIRRFEGHGQDVNSAVFALDGAQVLTASRDKTARLWETETGQEVRRFEGRSKDVASVMFSPDGKQILSGSRDTTARLWATATGQEVRRFEGHSDQVVSAVFSPDGRQVVTASHDGTARLWEAATAQEVRRLDGHSNRVKTAVFSPDGKKVLTASVDHTARLWETATGQEVRRFEGHPADVYSAVFSPDGTQVLTASGDATARLWETATGQEVRRFEGHSGDVHSAEFSPDGRQVVTASEDKTARLWEIATGLEVRRFEGHVGPVWSAVFSPDGKQVLTASYDWTARLWAAATGKEVRRFEGHARSVDSAVFSPDGKQILTASWDTTARLWDASTGSELSSLISFSNGGWAVTDPEGRFDASNAGDVEGLHWVVGMETIALGQLKERYYEPGLLAKHLGLNTQPLREVAAFTAPRLYPDVKAVALEGRLKIALRNRGGGIGKVVVMVNGKERTADARGPTPDAAAQTLILEEDLNGDPRLLPGEKNVIEVFAYNDEGYLRSRGVELEIETPGAKEAPSLWAVVAGVSEYPAAALKLKFAAKDAGDFAAALRIASPALFGAERTHVTLLTDAGAGRGALLEAFEDVRKKAKAGDILVIYLAGHGVTAGDSFYYLTAEARTADLSDPAVRAASTLSSDEVSQAIARIPALKQVLVLDTCASGKLIEDLTSKRSVDSSQVRALDRVKDRTGMFVLAGCASDRVSYEATQYGQGLLTYSLLLGMKGGQLRENRYVDVSTLFNFAADKVPEFAKDIGGVQRPIVATPRGGSSFDIGSLTEEQKAQVPLHSVRPLFVRTTLVDPDEGADLLDLSKSIDEALNTPTAGREAPLTFVDTRLFPGAYQVAGTYTTKDGTTRARFKLRRDKQAVTDWIEVSGTAEALPALIVEAAQKYLPADKR